jgi:hypothetical protein
MGEHEEGETYTVNDVLRDIAERMDERQDGKYYYSAVVRNAIMRLLVQVGVFVPVSEDEVHRRVREGVGVKLSDFPKFQGQRYEFVDWSALTPDRP